MVDSVDVAVVVDAVVSHLAEDIVAATHLVDVALPRIKLCNHRQSTEYRPISEEERQWAG